MSETQAEPDKAKSRAEETTDLLERAVKKACSVVETALYGQAHSHHPLYDPEYLRELRTQKLRGHLVLSQQRKRFWSETEVSPELYELGLDLLVRCSGLGVERGAILTEGSRLGILSLHHGYNDLNRGGPVGYWEVHYGEPSGLTAQLLSRELDGGTIISQHMIRSAEAPHTNRARIYSHTGQVIEHALARIAKNKPAMETDLYFREILKEPRAIQRVRLNTRLVSAYTQQLRERIFRKTVRGSRLHRDPLWKVYASTNPKNASQDGLPCTEEVSLSAEIGSQTHLRSKSKAVIISSANIGC